MVSVWASASSLPVIQCAGASKCVPVCSPQLMLFQYQAGPALVVARDLLDPERLRRCQRRRQLDHRRRRTQGLAQVDDADAAAGQRRGETGE